MSAAELAKRAIKALAEDLDGNAGLPKHKTVRYRRPQFVRPSDCPLMVVWLLGKASDPQTTEHFDSQLGIGVSWHEATVEKVATLINDPAVSERLLDALGLIEQRLRQLADLGLEDVPEIWQLVPGDTQYLPPELQAGVTEGYAVEAIARVTETAAQETEV